MTQTICWEQLQDIRKSTIQLYRFQMMSIIRLVIEDIDIVETFDELIVDSILPYNSIIKGHIRAVQDRFPHVILLGQGEKAKCKFCKKLLGWSCPDNPNGYCEYNYERCDPYGLRCIYCDHPEERK